MWPRANKGHIATCKLGVAILFLFLTQRLVMTKQIEVRERSYIHMRVAHF